MHGRRTLALALSNSCKPFPDPTVTRSFSRNRALARPSAKLPILHFGTRNPVNKRCNLQLALFCLPSTHCKIDKKLHAGLARNLPNCWQIFPIMDAQSDVSS
jgi:hypothetical protein